MSNTHHLKTLITSRYVTFHKALVESVKKPVRFLAHLNESDQRTVLGRTLQKIMTLTGAARIDELTLSLVKKKLAYAKVPKEEAWRVPFCHELLEVRTGHSVIVGFTEDECEEILNSICTS